MLSSAIALSQRPAHAYLTFADEFPGNSYKWGDTTLGTPSGTVTWGFMADGTDGTAIDGVAAGGSNITQLRSTVDVTYGAGAFDTAIQNAFDTWSSVANVTFEGPIADSGLPINDSGATTPTIRIGAFNPIPDSGFQFVGAVGFAPPPNGGTLEGDILFNLSAFFQIATGTEDVTPINYALGNDLEGLMLHELGHALGLAHPPTGILSVMYVGPDGYQTINHHPSADDIAGLRRIYGPATVPGDFDLDGDVDGADFVVWQTHFPMSEGGYLDVGDADNDGDVDGADFVAWQTNFPFTPGSSASPTPEPATWTIALLALGTVALRLRRYREG